MTKHDIVFDLAREQDKERLIYILKNKTIIITGVETTGRTTIHIYYEVKES